MRIVQIVTAALLVAAGATACSNDDNGGGGGAATPMPSVTADAALAAKVPAAIKSDGKITVGTEATYAPAEFLDTDGKTVIGFDIDLFKAVAARLGLTADFQQSTFGAIIPGVGTGKYEAGVSAFTINKERLQQANMTSYFNAGTQWAVKKGNPQGVSIDEPCGKRIAVQKDTVQVDDITVRSTACTSAGKAAVTINPYPGQDAVANSVASGKDDAMLADSPVTAYAVKQSNGELETLGDIYDSAPYGYVTAKAQTDFAEALRGAVQSLIDDGSYLKILQAWGVESGAIKTSQVNPA
ncbi:polar amino acid transport system substrate-binding protein [Hamadaea flava]|uniref:ABC transporter substrate-binding protein n=1 Tax=Hamadaea flava TaxID=1742688 RepID=A0ABV8LUA8_9ACTN|nr:ABC transporter substrate-binding protein [Hamadaea flava]MCP2328054.1 polar amino acid transport system substrate-binding protein [Hamadaea flava]